jgi:hypothetical protein
MKPRVLPCATYPLPDELLSSWIVRLAHAHLMKAYTFGRLVLPGVNLWNRDIDKAVSETVIQVLAARTPASVQQVVHTTLRSYEGRLYGQHYTKGNTPWILPLGIYHRTRRRLGMLFCPSCLVKDGATPYFRKKWRLAISVVCLDCGVSLQDQCPCCQEPIVFFRAELGRKSALPDRSITVCHKCGFDLRESVAQGAPATLISQQQEWYRIMEEGWRADMLYPHLYFEVLHHLVKLLFSSRPRVHSLQQYVVSQLAIPLPPAYFQLARGRQPFEQLPLEVRSVLLLQAGWLLQEWPHRFVEVGERVNLTSTPLLCDMQNPPFWYETVVKENFYVSNVNRRFPKK